MVHVRPDESLTVTAIEFVPSPVQFATTCATRMLPAGGLKLAVVSVSAVVVSTAAGLEESSASPVPALISSRAILRRPAVSAGAVAPTETGAPDVVVAVRRNVP